MDRKAAASARRRELAAESFRFVGETLGPVALGMSVFAITRGQFSMIDVVQYLVRSIEVADISVWTWTVADYEIEAVGGLMANGQIRSARLIVDYSASQRNRALLAEWRERFGGESVRVCRTHAKISRVWNESWHFLARGSMNLNWNPRFEQLDVTEGGDDFGLVERIEAEMPVLGPEPSAVEAANASGLGRTFEARTLAMFTGMPSWKP